MRKVLLTAVYGLFISALYAQDNDKASVAFVPFSESQGTQNMAKGPQICSAIGSAFIESKRFTVVPTDSWGMTQDATESQYISQAKDLGINYMIPGSISELSSNQVPVTDRYGNVTYSYSAHIVFSMRVMNAETGEMFASRTFKVGSGFLNSTSQEGAINNAISRIKPDVKKWIGETFPMTIGLVRVIEKDDRGGALAILISAGSESGIVEGKKRKKTQFKIVEYVNETFDGKTMKRTIQIGMAEVDRVNDANFTECIVTDGRMDVVKKLDEGKKLFLVTVN